MTDPSNGDRGRGQPERGEARINGVRLVYRTWPGPASPSYPSTVLLHGLLQSGEGMANLAAHVARGGPVVVPDLRGRGESDQPTDGYDPATMADDVAGLIEVLGLDRVVLIGRLHGGLIAYHLAARRPDLVRGLVLGDTAPEIDEQRAARALARIRALPARFDSLDAAVAYYEDALGLSAARARHDIPHDLVADEDGGYRWRHNLALVERIEAAAMPRADWNILAKVSCPLLLLRGQRGEVPPETADRFRQVIGSCSVQTILGARHDVFLGPGCEQAFGAIDLFLLRLCPAQPGPADDAATSRMASPAGHGTNGGRMVERVVRAINSRDDAAVAALFTPDGRIVQYRAGGKVRDGGLAEVRQAFWDIFADLPGGAVTARDVVVAGDRVACVLMVRDVEGQEGAETAILAPVFLRVREDRIVELTSYGLRLPAEQV